MTKSTRDCMLDQGEKISCNNEIINGASRMRLPQLNFADFELLLLSRTEKLALYIARTSHY